MTDPIGLPPVPRQDWETHQDAEYERTYQGFVASTHASDRVDASYDQTLALLRAPDQQAAAGPPAGPSPPGGQRPPSPTAEGGDLRSYARGAAARAGIDPDLFERQIQQESGFRADAVSGAGARGVAQIVPTAHPTVNPDDPHASLDYAATWMAQLRDRYGGDMRKALAAYNAGPGAVDQYGDVPPFEETQRYVRAIHDAPDTASTISETPSARDVAPPTSADEQYTRTMASLSGDTSGDRPPSEFEATGTPAATGAATGAGAGPGYPATGSVPQDLRPSQFGDPALSTQEAYSACGPAAAVAFARANGRNPSLREALDLAKQHGWTEAGGMNGVQNQAALLDALNVPYKLDTNPTWGRVQRDAMNGNPVTISTPGHYFVADAYDPDTGAYHVGTSGTDTRGGSEWMTPAQIESRMGALNGALFVDSPTSLTPSLATKAADPDTQYDSLMASLTHAGSTVVEAGKGVVGAVGDWWAGKTARAADTPDPMQAAPVQRMLGKTETNPSPLLDVPGQLGTALDRAGDVLAPMATGAAADRRDLVGASGRYFDPARTPDPGEADRLMGLAEPYATALTGEPIKIAGATGRALTGGARAADALGQPGMSLEVTGAARAAPAAATTEVARLRLDKFPEPVRETIQQAAEDGSFWRTHRRGVIPDAAAETMADDLGRSVDDLIKQGKAGRSYTTEETRAVRNAVVSQAMTVNELAAEIARAPHEAGAGLIARSVAEGMKLADLTRIAEGARAEAGRTLRAYQGFARDYAASPAGAIERIQKAVGGPEQAAKAVQKYNTLLQSGATPAQMASFWARAERPPVGFNDWFELVRRNSMLSGPRTLLVNALSGGTEVPWKLATDAVMSAARGRPGEIVPEARAVWAGLQRGITPAMETIAHGITEKAALAGDVPRSLSARVENPLAKGAALALEAPMRVTQATDDVVRSVGYSMHVAREAAVAASNEGLRGTAWRERVADLIAEPTPAMMKRADLAADDMTFKGDMGNLGRALNQFQKVPLIGPAVIPFLRTVYHITARGIDRSPLGLAGTGIDLARGVYGRGTGELGQALRGGRADLPKGVRSLGPRLTDNVLGTAASAWMYGQAMDGNITGAGPDDPEKVKMLEAQGWQRYAVRVGGRWVSYTNWGPLAVPLSLMAGAAEAQTYAKPGATTPQVVGDALGRSVKVLTEQNYLQGVGAIYKAVNDSSRYGEQWLTGYLQTLVPFGAAINTVGQATDPLIRQPTKGDVGQAMRARFPTNPLFAARESVPAKQDVLGRDVVNEQQGLAAVVPLRSSEGRPDATLKILLANGADIGAPPKEVKAVPLTPADQQRHQEIAGGLIVDTVGKITGDDRFAQLPPATRTKILQGAVEKARAAAGGMLLGEIGAEELKRRMLEKKAVGASP